MFYDGSERSVAERLTRSIGKSLKFLPAQTESPNGFANHGRISYVDSDEVIDDIRNDPEKYVRLWDWEESLIRNSLLDYFKTNLGQTRLKELQCFSTDSGDRLDEEHFQIQMVDKNESYASTRKIWYRIKPLRSR